jgi:hypothetical protein
MKKLLLLLMTVVIAGCSSDNDTDTLPEDELGCIPTGTDPMLQDGMCDDGVNIWTNAGSSSVFTDYYSLIDTIITKREYMQTIKVYFNENESEPSIKWTVNGIITSKEKSQKRWIGDKQKWIIDENIYIDVNNLDNVKIEAIVQFTDRNVRRSINIPITIKKEISDAFGFTFNMNRTDLNNIIKHDFSPQFASRGSDYWTFPCLFEFSNGKLIRLYGLQGMVEFNDVEGLSTRCKIPNPLEFPMDQLGNRINYPHILNPQEWTVGILKLKIFNISDMELLELLGSTGGSSREILCLTIEKIQ